MSTTITRPNERSTCCDLNLCETKVNLTAYHQATESVAPAENEGHFTSWLSRSGDECGAFGNFRYKAPHAAEQLEELAQQLIVLAVEVRKSR